MLGKLFSSRARVEILKLFLFNPEDSFYQRQISALTGQPIRGVQREVEKLRDIGLLDATTKGNRIYYKVNKNCPIFAELKSILLKSAGIAEALKKCLLDSKAIKAAFIYGSYAKGGETVTSDVDLLVVGTISSRELSSLLSKPKRDLGREINYAVFDPKELKDRVRQKDHFLTAVLRENKIFIVGGEDDLGAIIKSR